MKKKISYRSNFSEKIILISGLTRSGKSMLCPIVSSLEKVENFNYILLVEEILKLNYSGFIKKEVVDYLIKAMINKIVYENSIGRNFNFRVDDLSSAWKYKNSNLYLKRLLLRDDQVLKRIKKMKMMIPLMIHEGVIFSSLFFRNFPKLKMFHMQRNPIDLIYSWMKMGKEGKEHADPRHLYALFEINKKKTPYHSLSCYKKYYDLNYKDRVIMVFNKLINLHIKSFNLLPKYQKKRIHFVNFDSLVVNPGKELKKICNFLNTTKSNMTNKILKRENCPRQIDFLLREKKLSFIKKNISSNSLKILKNILEKYKNKEMFF